MSMVERAADQKLDGYRELGERVAAAENERDDLRAKYADALTVLRWSGTDVTDFNGTPEIHTSCGMSRGVPAIAAFERIRADLEARS